MKNTIHIILTEVWWFGLKEAQACIFAGLFFLAIFLVPRGGIAEIPRYDLLLIIALAIQIMMVVFKLETLDELKAICVFHIVGFVLEVFKTSGGIQSWSYQDFAYTKILNVPLFSGFMYAAVGSYIIQAWRLLKLRIEHHPPYWLTISLAVMIYSNFFTHHYFYDIRWFLAVTALIIYARTTVVFTPRTSERRMPLWLAFILIGFFIWLAENFCTLFGIWSYPHQMGAWSLVHLTKWSSWTLLAIVTFTILANLKHIKAEMKQQTR